MRRPLARLTGRSPNPSAQSTGSAVAEALHDQVVDAQIAAPHGRPCEACGAPVEPLDKFCPACGTPQASDEAAPAEMVAAEAIPAAVVVDAEPAEDLTSSAGPPVGPVARSATDLPAGQRFFRCQQCSSEVGLDSLQRSYVCPFCDSTYVVEFSPELSGRQRPEFVIGFAVTAEQAAAKFREWIRDNSWFRPGDLATSALVDRMRGVYLPFWSFAMLAESAWSASIGEYWYRTETYTTVENGKTVTKTRQVRETEWWPLAGRHHRYYSGYLVSGSRGLSQTDADRIQPFQLPALRRYEAYYLAGWMCEEYSIERDEALRRCQAEFYRREQTNVAAFLPGDTHSQLDVRTQFSAVSSDLCLLPIHILSYRYRDKVYRFLVNGQTGRVSGEKPLSWRRIGAFIAVIVALIALIGLIIALVSNR